MPRSTRWMPTSIAFLTLLLVLTASSSVVATQDEKAPTTGSVSVVVVDGDGQPLEGAIIECSAAASKTKQKADHTGEVVFADLPFGHCVVIIYPPKGQDLGKARQELTLSQGHPQHQITIDLVPGEWIEGVLLTPDGDRAPKAMYQAISQSDDQGGLVSPTEGFRFRSAPGDTYWLFVGMLPEDAGPFWTFADLYDVPSGTRGVELVYGLGGTFSAQPVRPDGLASEGEAILSYDVFAPPRSGRVWTTYEGMLQLEHVSPGLYSLVIEDSDGLMAIRSLEVKQGVAVDLSEIELSKPAVVRLPDPPFQRVVVLHEGRQLEVSPPKAKLPPGLYTLAVEEKDHHRKLCTFRLKPRDELNLEKYGR